MQTRIIRLFLLFICFLPGLALAEASQSIHVAFRYVPPPASPAVTGFKLYKDGVFVCQTDNPAAASMDCLVSPTSDTSAFTLTTTFANGTESRQSPPFSYSFSANSSSGTGNKPPQAVISATPTSGSAPLAVSFNGGGSTDSDGTISSYAWSFGDGSSATGQSVSHTYTAAGTYTAALQVTDDKGATGAASVTVVVANGGAQGTGGNRFTFFWEYDQTAAIKGFRIYQNKALLCQTNDPAARQLACIGDLAALPATFTMTAVNADNTETDPSNALVYTGNGDTDTQALKAVIAADIVSGEVPLAVSFSGAASTGNVTSYQWDFGDNSTAATATAKHTYTTAGTYTVKLTVADKTGAANTATVVITATAPAEPPTPPTAVISSSAATGAAPLTVSFDGSGSQATNATIASYAWTFGDGGSGTGAAVSHTYTAAGSYTATLTVTDSKGQSNSTTTPVVVTSAGTGNKPPQAVISATPTSGSAPLAVSFNGGGSTDSDGTISSYAWSFGDGGSATGQSVSHTYTAAGTYTAVLQVTDDKGATGAASVTVVVNANANTPPADVQMETGEVTVSGEWVRVPLTTPFTKPIVVAGPPSFNNADPCTIRIRNVDPTGFDISVTKWDYLTKPHPQETVSYLVMEQGRHTLPDGSAVEAGSFTGTASFKTVPFTSAFTTSPVVVTTVASMNDAKTISGRLKAITTSGFAYYFQEQEINTSVTITNPTLHLDETVHYIAWEPGSGTIGTMRYSVAKTANSVTDAWYSAQYQQAFHQPPLLLADMQTTNDAATAALRVQNQTAKGFQVKAEAEHSKNNKAKHSAETVGYITLDQTQTQSGADGLKAVIAADIVSGEAPLSVSFNGAASTGNVTSYQWDFGDGLTVTTQTASVGHTYTATGTYTVSLTVTDSTGTANTATVVITVTKLAVAPTLPTAVISFTPAKGYAPLTVKFDGSGLTAADASIVFYTWDFGDKNVFLSSTGTASHTYMSAGTYTVTLTVTDSKEQSGWATTSVVVSALPSAGSIKDPLGGLGVSAAPQNAP